MTVEGPGGHETSGTAFLPRDGDGALPQHVNLALFERAPDAILLADDEARYVDANPAACELTASRFSNPPPAKPPRPSWRQSRRVRPSQFRFRFMIAASLRRISNA